MKHPRPPVPHLPGAHWDAKLGKWFSQIRINGRIVRLGTHATPEQASAAWRAARDANPARPTVRPSIHPPSHPRKDHP